MVERKIPRIAEDSEEELSDEKEADRIGRYHWGSAIRGWSSCNDDQWNEVVTAALAKLQPQAATECRMWMLAPARIDSPNHQVREGTPRTCAAGQDVLRIAESR